MVSVSTAKAVLGYFVFLTDFTERILFNVLYCAKINRDKAEGKYNKYLGYGDDREPAFKLVL
jgi:hypothetical protein